MSSRIARILGAVTILWAGVAVAADENKVYHGTGCRVLSGTATYSQTGFICGSASCSLVCPLIRDRINDADTIKSVAVEGQNVTAGGFNCTVYMMDDDASGGSDVDASNKIAAGSGQVQLDYSAADLDADSGDEGSYAMFCGLATNDILYQYRVVEETALGGVE